MIRKLPPISLFVFSCIVSVWTLLSYNIPFFNYVVDNTNENARALATQFLLAQAAVIQTRVSQAGQRRRTHARLSMPAPPGG